MMLSQFRVRVKHNAGNAYREAVILAPGAFVACLWYKNFAKAKEFPVIVEKNGQAYETKSANKAYRRALKLDDVKLKKKDRDILDLKDAKEKMKAKELFSQCSLIQEYPYLI